MISMTSLKKSPYNLLKEWFYSPDSIKLDENIIKALNPISVIQMFGSLNKITIFIDKYFNNYEIVKLDHYEFYKELKNIVNEKKIGRYDYSFYKHIKQDKLLKELHKKFPYLKKYEIDTLFKSIKNEDMLEQLEYTLGISKKKKDKKKKLTKKELKEIKEGKKISSNNPKTKNKNQKSEEISFDELMNEHI
jgi:hypothetical protein